MLSDKTGSYQGRLQKRQFAVIKWRKTKKIIDNNKDNLNLKLPYDKEKLYNSLSDL